MKRLISILLVAIMVVSLAISASAACGINKFEAALLAKFCGVVDNYAYINPGLAAMYKNQAANTLAKVDLDAAACADLSAGIDRVVGFAVSHGINTKEAARKALPVVLGIVNGVAGKYGISVFVGPNGFVYVAIRFCAGGHPGDCNAKCYDRCDKLAGNCKLVKQTG